MGYTTKAKADYKKPTATDTVYADLDGNIVFTFTHSSGHTVFSGLSITLACETTYYATSRQLQKVAQRVATVEASTSCVDESSAYFGQVTQQFAQYGDKDGIVSKSYTLTL